MRSLFIVAAFFLLSLATLAKSEDEIRDDTDLTEALYDAILNSQGQFPNDGAETAGGEAEDYPIVSRPNILSVYHRVDASTFTSFLTKILSLL